MEGDAALGEEGGAEVEDGGTSDLKALVGEVVEGDGGSPVLAEVVLGEEIELEEAGEGIDVGGVVEGLAAGAGGEGDLAEARALGSELGGEALARDLGDPVADERGLCGEAGDDGVGVLVFDGGGERGRGMEFEVELGALAEDLAEVFAAIRDAGGCGGDKDGGDGAVDLCSEVCGGGGDAAGG